MQPEQRFQLPQTAQQVQEALLSVSGKFDTSNIRQTLTEGTTGPTTVPSTQAVFDELQAIDTRFGGLGALAALNSVALASSQTTGTLPVEKGGTGATTTAAARAALGVLNQTEIQTLIDDSIPAAQVVDLSDPAATTNQLPITKGGTGSSTQAGARNNLGVESTSETRERIAQNVCAADGASFAGFFTSGFTINSYTDIGVDANGNFYEYVGATLPHTVLPNTTPSTDSNYEDWFVRQRELAQARSQAASTGLTLRGRFQTGFTITTATDCGLATDGSLWQYSGDGSDLPRVVPAGTIPSTPNYRRVVFDSENRLRILERGRLESMGFQGTPSSVVSDTAILNQAFIDYDVLYLPSGVYPQYDISADDKIIHTEGKCVFTLPPNTVDPMDTVPVSALTISGDRVKVFGDLWVDGNSATNDSSGYNLSNRTGEIHISGDDIEIHGSVHIEDAHYVGFSYGNETDTPVRPYVERIVNHSSQSYIVSLWSCLEWAIGGIVNLDTTQDFDNRVYTGNQSISSQVCGRGHIGYILGRGTYGVFEINTVGLHIGYMDIAGWKSENTTDCTVDSARSLGITFDAWGFGVIQSTNFNAGIITVDNYQGTSGRAVQISSSTGSIGTLKVDNNQSPVDCEIFTVPNGFHVGNMDLDGRNGTAVTGLRIPSGFTRSNLTIGNLLSRRHTTSDAEIAVYDPDNIKILNVNSDITISAAYSEVINRNNYREGTDTVQMTAGSGTISLTSDNDTLSWTEKGRDVTLKGRLVVSSVSGASGTLRITGINSPPSDLPEASGEVPVTLYIQSLSGSPTGTIQGLLEEGSTSIKLTRLANGTETDDLAGFIQAGTRIVVGCTYSS